MRRFLNLRPMKAHQAACALMNLRNIRHHHLAYGTGNRQIIRHIQKTCVTTFYTYSTARMIPSAKDPIMRIVHAFMNTKEQQCQSKALAISTGSAGGTRHSRVPWQRTMQLKVRFCTIGLTSGGATSTPSLLPGAIISEHQLV